MRKPKTDGRERDYEVGWGRPPKSSRWAAGQSGNPKGRPKCTKNIHMIFQSALNQPIRIDGRGESRTIPAIEGIVRRVVAQALKGDLKAAAFLLAKEPEVSSYISSRSPPDTKDMSIEERLKVYQRMLKGGRP